ncbi:unnamed protein product [marine sediment metagenome]|uniref:Uncharacterized protein n=1 Tax=marine sediment metagenome TaxID=412755 RepID=X1GBP7_9ZZZZ
MNFAEIIAFLVVAVGAVGRVKYIWAGNKIRRQESTKDARILSAVSFTSYGLCTKTHIPAKI